MGGAREELSVSARRGIGPARRWRDFQACGRYRGSRSRWRPRWIGRRCPRGSGARARGPRAPSRVGRAGIPACTLAVKAFAVDGENTGVAIEPNEATVGRCDRAEGVTCTDRLDALAGARGAAHDLAEVLLASRMKLRARVRDHRPSPVAPARTHGRLRWRRRLSATGRQATRDARAGSPGSPVHASFCFSCPCHCGEGRGKEGSAATPCTSPPLAGRRSRADSSAAGSILDREHDLLEPSPRERFAALAKSCDSQMDVALGALLVAAEADPKLDIASHAGRARRLGGAAAPALRAATNSDRADEGALGVRLRSGISRKS